MKIIAENWTISDLVLQKKSINPKPQYQRTPVWAISKKIFLIDSILRGYDLPKFYIKQTPYDPIYQFEVTDGQQRMRTIWEFINGEFRIEGKEFRNTSYHGLKYDELPRETKDSFNGFKLSFTIIQESTQEEIRTLFARLQMGMTLIPVELRHALASNLGTQIFMVTETHKFFNDSSKIINSRFKHQDYLDHIIALIYYKNEKDIKAPTLYQLYLDLSNAQGNDISEMFRKINIILDWMYDINQLSKGIFKNKWGFIDSFWLLYENFDEILKVRSKVFAKNFLRFESSRKKYNSSPELLIEDKESIEYDKDLYDYIDAFNRQGSLRRNIAIRHRVFSNKFFNDQNFKLKNG